MGWKARHGSLPSLLMLFSNTRHSTDFLERMTLKAKRDKKIFTRRRCTWEGHPPDEFSGDIFYFDVANRRICDKEGNPLSLMHKTVRKVVGGF